ncbi:hypothetical protein GIB67_002085 [Kingdonia uniflora]|uniref:Uncharacterized protein n=1 Tax=Kingdonia uniflora TaxID=39325 RepID=A0A7J7KWQ0_9MAGN|nr:hypothetical protein GIB67_002085 [Kingdonia uniflora]
MVVILADTSLFASDRLVDDLSLKEVVERHMILLAVAIAGSGILAKRIFTNEYGPITGFIRNRVQKCDHTDANVDDLNPIKGISSSVHSFNGEICDSWSCDRADCSVSGKQIFRFSSLGGVEGSARCRLGLKGIRKKVGFGGNVELRKKGRKFFVCLKRRKISKNVFGRSVGSCYSTQDNSFFNWGLGVGIMCMVSAGKAEFDKLNAAEEETTKVVNSLKSGLRKRKMSRDLQGSWCKGCVNREPGEIEEKDKQPLPRRSGPKGSTLDDSVRSSFPFTEEGEYCSSILTEEPETKVLHRLEAELEFELQKISDPTGLKGTRSSSNEINLDIHMNDTKIEVSPSGLSDSHKQLETDNNFLLVCGVSSAELDRKLCRLLIEQQECHIMELKSTLQSAQAKLDEKDLELQSLKDCVRHLRKITLETISGMIFNL